MTNAFCIAQIDGPVTFLLYDLLCVLKKNHIKQIFLGSLGFILFEIHLWHYLFTNIMVKKSVSNRQFEIICSLFIVECIKRDSVVSQT